MMDGPVYRSGESKYNLVQILTKGCSQFNMRWMGFFSFSQYYDSGQGLTYSSRVRHPQRQLMLWCVGSMNHRTFPKLSCFLLGPLTGLRFPSFTPNHLHLHHHHHHHCFLINYWLIWMHCFCSSFPCILHEFVMDVGEYWWCPSGVGFIQTGWHGLWIWRLLLKHLNHVCLT